MALPDYIKRAKNNYNSKFELIQLRLPEGAKGRIKAIIGDSGSMAAFCVDAVMEAIEGYEAAEEWTEEDTEAQEAPSERPQEPQKEDNAESVRETARSSEKPQEKRDNAVMLADLQAQLDRKRQEQEERKEKLEAEKEQRKAEEREQKRAEMRAYVEKLRDGVKESRERQAIVQAVLNEPGLLENVLDPSRKEEFISKFDVETYNAIVEADKERKREESKQAERMHDVEELPDFMSDI